MFHAQVRQCPANLGWAFAIDRAVDLRGKEIVAAAVRIEAQWQAMRGEDFG
jgi:hypothetical protein